MHFSWETDNKINGLIEWIEGQMGMSAPEEESSGQREQTVVGAEGPTDNKAAKPVWLGPGEHRGGQ